MFSTILLSLCLLTTLHLVATVSDLYQPAQVEIERFRKLQERLKLQEMAKANLEQMHQQRQHQLVSKLPLPPSFFAALGDPVESRMPSFYEQAAMSPMAVDVRHIPMPQQPQQPRQQRQGRLQSSPAQSFHQQLQPQPPPNPPLQPPTAQSAPVGKMTIEHFKTPELVADDLNHNLGIVLANQGALGHLGKGQGLAKSDDDHEYEMGKFMDNSNEGEGEKRNGHGGNVLVTTTHHHGHHKDPYSPPYRCFACQWSIAQCSDFNCYNNPDRCTTNHFDPHHVQQGDCLTGCEQYVVTDPNGLIQTWKRGCAPAHHIATKSFQCHTHYQFGIRFDRCICSRDGCNHARTTKQTPLILIVTFASFILLLF